MSVDYAKYKFLDIGNTSIKLNQTDGIQFAKPKRFLTKYFKPDHILPYIKEKNILLVSSVVDELTHPLKNTMARNKIEIRFLYKEDAQLVDFSKRDGDMGADMVAQIEGAASLFKRSAFCVVSMGTAITVMVVDHRSVFQGGVIMPDYKLQLDSLSRGTSKLPFLSYHLTKEIKSQLLSVDSKEAMQQGTYHMIYHGLQGIIKILKLDFPKMIVVGTGGFGIHYKELFDHYNENLLFLGLKNIFLEN